MASKDTSYIMRPLRVNTQVLPYLTPEARSTLSQLTAQGWDPDLALALLETCVPEEHLYCFEEENEEYG